MEGKGSQAMEKNHPVSELMAETIEKIKEAVDANTVVGEPIVAGEITLIPVSKISLGFGTGGSEMGGKTPKVMGENPFGGGGGAGLKVTPVCFRVVDLIPDVVNRIAGLVEEKKAKKPASEEPDGPAGNP